MSDETEHRRWCRANRGGSCNCFPPAAGETEDDPNEQRAAILRAGIARLRRELADAERALEKISPAPASDEKPRPSRGPWLWVKLDENSRVLRHSGGDDPYYSAVFHPDIDGMGIHISDADAALIADAPAMLELLRETAQIDLACYCVAATEVGGLARPALVCWPCRVRTLLKKHGRTT